MVQQVEIILTPRPRGFHLVTGEIVRQLPRLPKTGLLHLFCYGLTILGFLSHSLADAPGGRDTSAVTSSTRPPLWIS